jgi:hypothetical protein
VSALDARFSEGRSGEKAQVTLTGRRQRKDESLAELAADIEGLIHQAYPEGSLHLWDALSKDYFINALKNAEMQLQVKLRQPTTLQEALEMAQNYEAITESCHQPVRAVRRFQAEEESSFSSWKGNQQKRLPYADRRKTDSSEGSNELLPLLKQLI